MNPSRISTPIRKEIDEWFFHVKDGKNSHLKFRIDFGRERDIELVENFRFHAVGVSDGRDPAGWDIKVFSAASLPELRELCTAYARALEEGHWRKVVVIYAQSGMEGEHIYATGDRPVLFDWGVGERSSDGKFFRKLEASSSAERFHWNPQRTEARATTVDRHLYDDAGYLTRSGHKHGKAVVHPWSQALEDACREMDAKFLEFADRLSELVKQPQILVAVAGSGRLLGGEK